MGTEGSSSLFEAGRPDKSGIRSSIAGAKGKVINKTTSAATSLSDLASGVRDNVVQSEGVRDSISVVGSYLDGFSGLSDSQRVSSFLSSLSNIPNANKMPRSERMQAIASIEGNIGRGILISMVAERSDRILPVLGKSVVKGSVGKIAKGSVEVAKGVAEIRHGVGELVGQIKSRSSKEQRAETKAQRDAREEAIQRVTMFYFTGEVKDGKHGNRATKWAHDYALLYHAGNFVFNDFRTALQTDGNPQESAQI